MTTVILIIFGLSVLIGAYGLYDFSKLNKPVTGKYAGRINPSRVSPYSTSNRAMASSSDSSFTDGLITGLIVEDLLTPAPAPDTSGSFGGFGGGDFGGGGAGGSWDSSSSSTPDTSSSYDSSSSSSSYDSGSSSSSYDSSSSSYDSSSSF